MAQETIKIGPLDLTGLMVPPGSLNADFLKPTKKALDFGTANALAEPVSSLADQTGYLRGLSTQFLVAIDDAEVLRRTRRAYWHKKWPFKSLTDCYGVGQHRGEFAVVGAGPSLANDWDKLREMAEPSSGVVIVALNNAHDALLDNGIKPDLAIMIEARERAVHYMTPTLGVGYLFGTQVCDGVLERFLPVADQVHLFHVMVSEKHRQIIKRLNNGFSKINIPGVTGATTVGLRAYDLLTAFLHAGTINWFGMDSSASDNIMHAKTKSIGVVKPTRSVRLMRPDGRTFKREYFTDDPMFLQAGQFWQITEYRAAAIRKGQMSPFKILFHGRGLLPDWAACHGFHANNEQIIQELEAEGYIDEGVTLLTGSQGPSISGTLAAGAFSTGVVGRAEEDQSAEAQPNGARELGEPEPNSAP